MNQTPPNIDATWSGYMKWSFDNCGQKRGFKTCERDHNWGQKRGGLYRDLYSLFFETNAAATTRFD